MTINNESAEGNPTTSPGPRAVFYSSILPREGVRCLAAFKNGLKSPPVHTFYSTDTELLEAADAFDAKGVNVYHACATFKEPVNRKGENVLAIKSIWLDLDVGEKKPYATQKEAAAHFEQFRTALDLPRSHVISSGGGIHEYLPFTKAITPEQWDRLAGIFAQCLDHYGVKHDTSRTQDKASILRIPGTSNFKTDPAKAVTLKRMGEEVPAADLWKALKTYADANGIIVGTKARKGKLTETNDLIGNRLNYPPSKAENIIAHCAVLSEVAETGGDVPYEIWWRAMGVAKHTTDPVAVAANWTRNRQATGHDKTDFQAVLDRWIVGPTTCPQFALHSDKCASCPQAKGAV